VVLGAGASQNLGAVEADPNECKWDSENRGDLKSGESRSCAGGNYDDIVDWEKSSCHCGNTRTGRTCVEVTDSYNVSKYRCALPTCDTGNYSGKTCLADGKTIGDNEDNNRCACPDDHQCSESTKTCLPKCGSDSSKCDEECYCSKDTTCKNITAVGAYGNSTAKKCMLPECTDACDDSCSCGTGNACHAAAPGSYKNTCKPVCSSSSNDTRLTGNDTTVDLLAGNGTCSGDNATCTCGSGKICEKKTIGAQYGGNKYECQDVPETNISTPVVDATVITETAVVCSSVSGSDYANEEENAEEGSIVKKFTEACTDQSGCETEIAIGTTVCSSETCKCKTKPYTQTEEDALVSSAQKCFSWFAVLVMILQL